MSSMPELARVQVAANGNLTVNGVDVPYIDRLTVEWPVHDVPVMTVRLPVFDMDVEDEVHLVYAVSIDRFGGRAGGDYLSATGNTPQEALRALADALDARDGAA